MVWLRYRRLLLDRGAGSHSRLSVDGCSRRSPGGGAYGLAASAGFVPPRRTPSSGLWAGFCWPAFAASCALVLTLPSPVSGPPIWLTTTATKETAAARLVTVDGYVASYPVLKEGQAAAGYRSGVPGARRREEAGRRAPATTDE